MEKIFVTLDQNDVVTKNILENIRLANTLGEVYVISEAPLTKEQSSLLAENGVSGAIFADLSAYTHYGIAPFAEFVTHVVDTFVPEAILFSNTVRGKELAGTVAVLSQSGIVTDVYKIIRQSIAGDSLPFLEAYKEISLHSNPHISKSRIRSVTQIFTVKTGNFLPEDNVVVKDIENICLDFIPAERNRKVTVVKEESDIVHVGERIKIYEASKIIVAGRGVGADYFEVLEELSKEIGATIGVTKVLVDQGFADHSMQVGQSGYVISPKLYLGMGVSGASLHQIGMRNSETIIAINKDPEAPIFEIADFGVVGDIFEIIPDLLAEIRERKS